MIRSAEGNGIASQSAGASSTSGKESQNFGGDDFTDIIDLYSDQGYERMNSIYKEMVNEIGFQDSSFEVEVSMKENVENPNTMKR